MDHNVFVPKVQPELTITFDSQQEARDLYDELRKWNSGRNANIVEQFFRALEEVFTK